ncbi:MAG: CehA/McbA family metallohydrolase [Bryobacteraceae bacterium]|nr:CehA/McbA family metallohydrolase [Bryobacteraceae bacterium]
MKPNDATRRSFIQAFGAAPPMALAAAAQQPPGSAEKFTPVDLGSLFDATPEEFGAPFSGSERADLARIPVGSQTLRGIPFLLGPGGDRKSWLVVRRQTVEIPLAGRKASYLCLAQFCDWFERERLADGQQDVNPIGERLADAALEYDDGSEETFPVRRRFEVSSPSVPWGQLSFAAQPHRADAPTSLNDPLKNAMWWGDLQTGVADNAYGNGTLWLWALPNPHPERPLKALRLRGAGGPLVVCGLTLFHRQEHPLRYLALSLYRLTISEGGASEGGAEERRRWQPSVDLGVVARSYALAEFNPEAWLASPAAGIGERERPAKGERKLYLELTAAREATLSLHDARTGQTDKFDLSQAASGQPVLSGGKRLEAIERHSVWIHGQVTDAATGKPTPVRVAFRSSDGRYIPPYGHRAEISTGWFQDYGADIKVLDSSFAYIDGSFQVELPVGEIFVEISKGFEYQTVRRRLKIERGQRRLDLQISRFADLRGQGWMTADTHVHFLSPSTAVLEGQAEGVNLVNLLAAQWGDLFTNVGDLAHGPLTSRDGETTVWVGTENRQHLLGHLALLGGHGEPVYPMSASGPGESYLGDPVRTSLADWADACRRREGVVVAVHFPYPIAELAADIALGKIDGLEIYPQHGSFNTLRLRDWYRYLNCGYRLPCVGGTDKMGAYMPVGANRTYAHVGDKGLDFANWAAAVRKGNTFTTTGPLLLLQVDGKVPGDEIMLGAGGGSVEAQVEVRSAVPVHRIEIVRNGEVVASREASQGARDLKLNEKIKVAGPAWIAARCASNYGPTAGGGLGIQAHTSPVYLRVAGQELFSSSSASYMLTLIDGAETWLNTLATRPDEARFAQVLKTLADARKHLHERLHKHGIPH